MSVWWRLEALSFATAIGGYLVGSIPFGLILTRAAGLGDIRDIGSGNIGATNVLRTGRKGLAAGTLILDAAKGALAVQLTGLFLGIWLMPLAGLAAVIGHCYPCWLRFRGGKGVATGLGVMLALDWRVGALCCATWVLSFAATRMSSAGALSAFIVAPALAALLSPAYWWLAALCISALIIRRHEENIRRLAAGTEPKVGRR